LVAACQGGAYGLVDAFQHGIKAGPKAGKKSCFGVRVNDGPYVWESYDEVADRVTHFGSGLIEVRPVFVRQS
jgi:hypothetical protein